jgi:hypothetical protein
MYFNNKQGYNANGHRKRTYRCHHDSASDVHRSEFQNPLKNLKPLQIIKIYTMNAGRKKISEGKTVAGLLLFRNSF